MNEKNKVTGKYECHVICDVANSGVYLDKIESSEPVTLRRLIQYYSEKRGFDWDEDTIHIVEGYGHETVDLDAEGV